MTTMTQRSPIVSQPGRSGQSPPERQTVAISDLRRRTMSLVRVDPRATRAAVRRSHVLFRT